MSKKDKKNNFDCPVSGESILPGAHIGSEFSPVTGINKLSYVKKGGDYSVSLPGNDGDGSDA